MLYTTYIYIAGPFARIRRTTTAAFASFKFCENLYYKRIKIRRYGRERTSSIFTREIEKNEIFNVVLPSNYTFPKVDALTLPGGKARAPLGKLLRTQLFS